MDSTDGSFLWIVQSRIAVTALLQGLNPPRSARTKIVQPAEDNRFRRADFCAGRREPALLPVITKGAFERAAGIGKWCGPAIDHAEGTGDHAITAAVADIVLDEDGSDFGADDRTGGTRLETAGVFAVFADVREKNPAKRILALLRLTTSGRRFDFPSNDSARRRGHVARSRRRDGRCCHRSFRSR